MVELSNPDDNRKLVKESPLVRLKGKKNGDDDGLYPNISGWSTVNGVHSYRHENPEHPEATVEEILNADGSYKTTEVHPDKKGIVSELNHHTRSYNSGGHSHSVDGHHDHNVESTSNHNVGGDMGHGIGGNRYSGVAGAEYLGSQHGKFYHSAECVDIQTSKGDVISEHAGDKHTSHEGDEITSITGNKHLMISEGEYGIHLHAGNMDTQLDAGKYRVKTAREILIESDTKITLKVGKSTIVIKPDSIEIMANDGIGRIDINK